MTPQQALDVMRRFRDNVCDHGSVQLMMLYEALSHEWQDYADLAKSARLTKSAMSRNMKKLKDAGVVRIRTDRSRKMAKRNDFELVTCGCGWKGFFHKQEEWTCPRC